MRTIHVWVCSGLALFLITGCVCKKSITKAKCSDSSVETFNWPVAIPPQFQPDKFKDIFQKAVSEAQARIELVGFDCRFPPCIAQFRDPDRKVREIYMTPTFKKYFPANTFSIKEIGCGAAGIENVSFLAGALEDSDTSERIRGLVKNWHCASGKTAAQVEEEEANAPSQPVPWPQSIPEQFKGETFANIIRQVVEQTQAPLILVGTDCQEYPCIAIFRNNGGNESEFSRAAVWREKFGNVGEPGEFIASIYQGPVGYGECNKDPVVLFSPLWEGDPDTKVSDKERQSDPILKRKFMNKSKRMTERWEAIRKAWKCAPAQ